ncbi:MAG: AMP-binding protein [Flavobacteriaceae bacterium]|nr:MAG: AMP-binding protein [Flavobacteriaceae bacterium]
MHYILPHIIEESSKKYPNKIAFRYKDQTISYLQLYRKSTQVSNVLLHWGVKRGDRVGIYLDRCLENAAAIYGIMSAGAAYVPLDPFAPAERTRYLLEDCTIQFVISNPNVVRPLQNVLSEKTQVSGVIGCKPKEIEKTISWEEVGQMSEVKEAIPILDQDLAYIMYTSGTTGNPKGIMHTHRSGLEYAKLSADLYKVNKDDIIGNHASLYVDISTFGYFSAPLSGATTVIIPEAHTKMPASLARLIEKEKLTIWYSVPLVLIQLLQNKLVKKDSMSSLRWVLYGGESFPTKHIIDLKKLWPHVRFSNVYGPAEVNQCTYHHIESVPKIDDQIPIGKAWGNTELLVVDKQDNELTFGNTGELLVRTSTMMNGYWRRPDLTAKALYKKEEPQVLLKRITGQEIL